MSDLAQFQLLAGQFVDAVAQYESARDEAGLERLRRLRLEIVPALLELSVAAVQGCLPSIMQFAGTCVRSGIRNFPRTPTENELFARCLERLLPWTPDTAPVQGLPALLLAHHAFELKFIPPLASIPAAAREAWVYFLCEKPPAFIHSGDAEQFALYLANLCRRICENLNKADGSADDLIEAFSRSGIFMQSYFNELNLRGTMRLRGTIIEQMLERGGGSLDQLRVMRPIRQRPRIGFISLVLDDGSETVFLAAHMQHLDRARYEVRLYSLFEPNGSVGARCREWAHDYARLPEKVEQAVARLRREDLDLAIFCNNLTAVNHPLTRVAAHRVARIQASTIASPVSTGLRNIDVMIPVKRTRQPILNSITTSA